MVASAVEPHITVEALTKFVPVTVRVNGALAATAVVGLSEVIVGPETVKTEVGDAAPPGLCTAKLSLPTAAASVGGTVAVMDVELLAVTAKAVVPE